MYSELLTRSALCRRHPAKPASGPLQCRGTAQRSNAMLKLTPTPTPCQQMQCMCCRLFLFSRCSSLPAILRQCQHTMQQLRKVPSLTCQSVMFSIQTVASCTQSSRNSPQPTPARSKSNLNTMSQHAPSPPSLCPTALPCAQQHAVHGCAKGQTSNQLQPPATPS